MIFELTDQNYETVLRNSQHAVIDFMAEWCSPCKMVGAALEVMDAEYNEHVFIAKVDVDANPELTAKFGVRNMPTVLYLKDGEVLDKQVGSTTKKILEEKLKAILQN